MMSTQTLPGSDAARHGTGQADLTIMLAAHDAFRRDLVTLARTASRGSLADPVRRLAIAAGWDTFKRQLLQHHEAEDTALWPALRARLGGRRPATSALSTLDAMEAEHELIDPLLAAVDAAFADEQAPLGDVIGELASKLTGHLGHEERDALPLIGATLTAGEWSGVVDDIQSRGSAADAIEMVPWMLDHVPAQDVPAVLAQFPPVVSRLYHIEWKPRYDAQPRW